MCYKLPPRLYLALVTLHELLFYLCFATLKGEIETKVTVNKFPEVFYNNIWHNPWKPAEIAKQNNK